MPAILTLATPDGQPRQQVTVPLDWSEVTIAQFAAIYAPAEGEARTMAEVLADLPAGTLDQLSTGTALWLTKQLAFAADPTLVLADPPEGQPDPSALSFGALLLAQQYLEEAGEEATWPKVGPYLLALYRSEMVWGKYVSARVDACHAALLASPVSESGAACRAIVNQVVELAERFRPDDQDHIEPSDAEYDAGSEELAERFSHLLSLDSAAGGLGYEYERVLKQDAATVLMKLTLEGARAAFMRRVSQYQAAEVGRK